MSEKVIKGKADEAASAQDTVIEEKDSKETKPSVIKYSMEELSKAANTLFGVQPECVTAAFLVAGIQEVDKGEAEKIVREFMRREVK